MESAAKPPTLNRYQRVAIILAPILLVLGTIAFFVARSKLRSIVTASLPQIDGALAVPGLTASVSVQRDAQGVPHIRAASVDDLVFAQAFVTAQDRLFQMDLLRRHGAGTLAEILGPAYLDHDRTQRTLMIRAAADRAAAQLPPDQLHLLQVYAAGVNASIAQQSQHLPVEFRLLQYDPAPWTPRDSLLVQLVMFQDLTTEYPAKLAHETLATQLTQSGAADLLPDLYSTTTPRDFPPAAQSTPAAQQIPGPPTESTTQATLDPTDHLPLTTDHLPLTPDPCSSCFPGSNNWVVSGAHTATGKPLLSNDMHLNHRLPGIWYAADLEAPIPGSTEPLHVAGVSLPGIPLIVVGHNQHVAWGFTNLGGDVQDLYLETLRGTGSAQQFQAADGSWQPVLHFTETIRIGTTRHETLYITATRHGDAITPILTPILKSDSPGETRPIALRWTVYDPAVIRTPVYAIATTHDWPSFLAAFAQFGGPSQNAVYADDQGHIGYHAIGRIPLRPAGLSETPVPSTPDREWSGYVPFDQLPQVFDPPSGVLATANARITPDGDPTPLTLNWGSSYRTQRILHLLEGRTNLTPADMLAIQTDVYSDFDHTLAQRLVQAVDHSTAPRKPDEAKRLHQIADILRNWNGFDTTNSAAAEIVSAVHAHLWTILLAPHIKPGANASQLYQRYSRDSALEALLAKSPQRWLPPGFTNWDDLLATATIESLLHGPNKAPANLATWTYGTTHTVDIEHPIFAESKLLTRIYGLPTGTGPQPQSGGGTTIKQVGHTFGPSERFTANLADLDHSTLNLVTGQSGIPASPWFLDQFPAWYHGTTYPFPFTAAAVNAATTHTLTLTPK